MHDATTDHLDGAAAVWLRLRQAVAAQEARRGRTTQALLEPAAPAAGGRLGVVLPEDDLTPAQIDAIIEQARARQRYARATGGAA